MTYAVISDTHGNIDALTAVLNETEKLKIDSYIFAGDYSSYLPYPNETVEKIRSIKNAIVIKGNEEGYLDEYAKQDQNTWTDGQFQAHYWLYKTLTESNHAYLKALPENTVFNDGSIKITVTHMSSDLYGTIEYKSFSSNKIAQKYATNFICRDTILHDIQEYVSTSSDFHEAIQPLANGVYIFGHTHI